MPLISARLSLYMNCGPVALVPANFWLSTFDSSQLSSLSPYRVLTHTHTDREIASSIGLELGMEKEEEKYYNFISAPFSGQPLHEKHVNLSRWTAMFFLLLSHTDIFTEFHHHRCGPFCGRSVAACLAKLWWICTLRQDPQARCVTYIYTCSILLFVHPHNFFLSGPFVLKGIKSVAHFLQRF